MPGALCIVHTCMPLYLTGILPGRGWAGGFDSTGHAYHLFDQVSILPETRITRKSCREHLPGNPTTFHPTENPTGKRHREGGRPFCPTRSTYHQDQPGLDPTDITYHPEILSNVLPGNPTGKSCGRVVLPQRPTGNLAEELFYQVHLPPKFSCVLLYPEHLPPIFFLEI